MWIGRVREQGKIAISPQPQLQQWALRKQAVATDTANPRTSRRRGYSATEIRQRSRIVHALQLSSEHPCSCYKSGVVVCTRANII